MLDISEYFPDFIQEHRERECPLLAVGFLCGWEEVLHLDAAAE